MSQTQNACRCLHAETHHIRDGRRLGGFNVHGEARACACKGFTPQPPGRQA